MRYYVSYSGSTIVDADNEDEACELALDEISIEDINAYLIQEDGTMQFHCGHR